MKKCLILFCSVLLANLLLAATVNTDPPYDSMLDKVYKAEFISETTSDLLKTNLANVFSRSFDVVERVDLHRDAEGAYYYAAYGLKDAKHVVDLISTADEWAFAQFYPSKVDMGFAADEFVIDCFCKGWKCVKDGNGRKCGVAGFELPCVPKFCLIPIPIDN